MQKFFIVAGAALASSASLIPPADLEQAPAMSVPRAAHTATALRDGRVLIAGGFTNQANAAQGAELFDPVAGRFGRASRMVTLRHSHTATVLRNGKVLLVGGYSGGSATTAAAEIFDPATGAFTRTGSLATPRAGHVAVLLENGKVLIAGGVGDDWAFLSSAELYDPATGRFTAASPMSVARESHVAVRLTDGRVLIAGGHRGRRADIVLYRSAEIFDPATGRFTPTGDMGIRRHKHDGVLLRDGRVLITGGSDERDSEGAYDSTELFDPATGRFAPGGSMHRARYKHNGTSLLLPTGVVLIGGGASQAEIWNPATAESSLVRGTPRMAGQFSAVAPVPGGRVLITGGYGNGSGPRASAWLYKP
jgi:hypothetical protein